LAEVCEINRSVRDGDEWFDDPDDLERVARVLASITDDGSDPIGVAGVLMARIARAQAFGEGNKRTAFVAAVLFLEDANLDGAIADSEEVRQLLVRASMGADIEAAMISALRSGLV
jgi:prophage maintenance system killer protein